VFHFAGGPEQAAAGDPVELVAGADEADVPGLEVGEFREDEDFGDAVVGFEFHGDAEFVEDGPGWSGFGHGLAPVVDEYGGEQRQADEEGDQPVQV
jgi:hypothetical protein